MTIFRELKDVPRPKIDNFHNEWRRWLETLRNRVASIPKSFGGEVNALIDATTVASDANDNDVFSLTLTQNITLAAPTNIDSGRTYTWIFTQDGTGGHSVTYNSIFKAPIGGSLSVNTTANYATVVRGTYDGTQILCEAARSYAL
jgi:hypothetical protein